MGVVRRDRSTKENGGVHAISPQPKRKTLSPLLPLLFSLALFCHPLPPLHFCRRLLPDLPGSSLPPSSTFSVTHPTGGVNILLDFFAPSTTTKEEANLPPSIQHNKLELNQPLFSLREFSRPTLVASSSMKKPPFHSGFKSKRQSTSSLLSL